MSNGSDQQKAADAARASERRNASMVRASLDAIITIDSSGAIIQFNPAAESLFGYSESDAVGKNIGELVVPSHLRHELQAAMTRHLTTGEGLILNKRVEMPVRRRDGSEVITELAITLLDGTQPPLFAWFLRDLTGEKASQARIARLLSDLQLADRNKTDFLATLSHELRDPLAPMRNALELIAHSDATQEAREKARDIITRQVLVMERLVDDLLDISRISRDKLSLREESIELAAVLNIALEISLPLIASKHQEVKTSPLDESISLTGDPVRLAQVFVNLLTNASKYTDPGGQISLIAERRGTHAVVTVKDSGVGIAPDVLPRVFEKFWQADVWADRSRGGLGIGLTLVKRLVEMHHGTVEARSEGLGRGTEVVVRLPLRVATQTDNGGSET
jgi:PAS domain S-box-containing protein